MRKFLSVLLALTLVITGGFISVPQTTVQAAETITSVVPEKVSSFTSGKFNSAGVRSYSVDDDKTVDYSVYKFTINEDAIVCFQQVYSGLTGGSDWCYGFINVSTNSVFSSNEYSYDDMHLAGTASVVSAINYVVLHKGTYYVKMGLCHKSYYQDIKVDEGQMSITYMPLNSVLSVKQTVNSNQTVTLSFDPSAISKGATYGVAYGDFQWADNTMTTEATCRSWIGDCLSPSSEYFGSTEYYNEITAPNTSVNVVKNGTYTIKVWCKPEASAGPQDEFIFRTTVKVNGVPVPDGTAPTISGASNGKYYKKNVAIKYSDKGTGVKTATVNGSSIRSGYTIKKTGNYTVTVVDKAGNKSSISFRVDKNKPKISGAKNKKTYKKAVTVKASDVGTWIKSFKVNGKSVSTYGYKIKRQKKTKTYKVVATDYVGNKTAITFKIKGKK